MTGKCAPILIVVVCLLAVALPALCDSSIVGHPEGWVNALKPKGTPGPELTLASKGKAKYDILLSAKPTTKEKKAAEDLALWLGKMTDAKFRVIREPEKCEPGRKVISIGKTALLEDADLWQAKTDLKNEGYAIAVDSGNLFLLGGKTRGIINTVYALLEEDLGCRWYDWRNATIPRIRRLTFRPTPRKFVPLLEIRDIFHLQAFDRDWSLRNRMNSNETRIPEEWGGQFNSALFVHTYNQLMPPNEFFKDHPEYYSELNGKRQPQQLCLSNPDVLKIMTQRVLEMLRKNPNCEEISVSPNDWMDYCDCKNCDVIVNAEGSNSGPLIKFVNAVAEQVEKEFPEVKISTLAYLGTFKPPKTIKPRHNVAIQLCTDSHSWQLLLLRLTDTNNFQQAMKDWDKQGANIHIWDYVVNFSHHINPTPNIEVVNYAIKWYARHGAGGVMLQGNMTSYGSDNVSLKTWVWSKLLWDYTLDSRELMRDFVYGYYGEAAEPMWEYNEFMRQTWQAISDAGIPKTDREIEEIGCRFPPTAFWLTPDFLDRSFAILAKAEAMAKDPLTVQRVKAAKLPALYARLSQDVGYVNTMREKFKPGTILKDGVITPEERAKYAPMVDELESIVKAEKIAYFFETDPDAGRRIQLWKDKLGGGTTGEAAKI